MKSFKEAPQFRKWLESSPVPIISLDEGEFSVKENARFLCSTSHVYDEGTQVIIRLENLKKIFFEKEDDVFG